jgi:hypothetical protein
MTEHGKCLKKFGGVSEANFFKSSNSLDLMLGYRQTDRYELHIRVSFFVKKAYCFN